MAEDQVRYSDLFDGNIASEVQRLTNEIISLRDAIAAAKNEANGLRDNLRGAGTATRDQQQQTTADAAAVEALNRQVKDLTDKLSRLEAQRAKYGRTTVNNKKLTEEEAAAVENLRKRLQGTAQEQIEAVRAIDLQNKSYNELYQTYNAIKDVLNAMTTAERQNSEAGKEMVNRAKEIRDTLNKLQQDTGNYTLNVGNYMSALNGLQFQTQQVLREIPSAQNLSQFFLAISNNIPMFADALARYNKGLPEIKAKLAAVTAEIAKQRAAMAGLSVASAEYAARQVQLTELQRQQQQLQGASVSGWRAVLKAVGSWQTLLIAGLLLLRKMPEIVKKIAEWWDRWRNGVKEVKNEVGSIAAMGRLQADVLKKTADETTELQLVVEKLRNVKRGTDEWAAGVRTVNEITKSNLDVTKATPEEIERVTAAYVKQAEQLAKNAVLTDMIGKSMANQSLRDVAYNAENYETARHVLGLEIDSKNEKMLRGLYNTMQDAVRDYNNRVVKSHAKFRTGVDVVVEEETETFEQASKNRKKEMDDAIQDYRNFINERLEVLTPDAVRRLQEEYELIDPMSGSKRGGSKPSEQAVRSRYWEAQEAVLRAQYEGYELERALAKMNQDKAMSEQEAWYEEQQKALAENLKNGYITRQRYDEQLKELGQQNGDLQREIERKYWADIRALDAKEIKGRSDEMIAHEAEMERERKEGAKKELKAMADGWQEQRAEMVKEGVTRRKIVEAEVAAEVARLKMMMELNRDVNGEIMSDEQRSKVEEWIALLEKIQRTGNYSNIKPGQVAGKGAENISSDVKNWSNIAEVMRDVLDVNITNEQISALNGVFGQAKEALSSWMDARKAAADQAKSLADDEVSAAENALNREIELRNQGYANDVALRERELADAKEKQRQAVEEQAKIAKEQVKIDAAMQASSMITASANIIKQFPNPLAWVPMLATMWGAFLYAKQQAYSAAEKSVKFREGGVMMLDGGSHQSGHDVSLGVGPDGSNLRAEGGEYFAVINKRNSRKYGREIPGIVNAINGGVFEDRYIKTSDAVGLLPRFVRGDDGTVVDLSAVESGVGQLVKQGERSWSVEGEYRVMRYKNLTRRVRVS